MSNPSVLALESIAAVALTSMLTLISGTAAARAAHGWSTPRRLRMLLSFGSGYLLALAILELIPHSYAHFDGNILITGVIAGIGAAAVWLVEKLITRETTKPKFKPVTSFSLVTHQQPPKHWHNLLKNHKACCGIDTTSGLSKEVVLSAIGCIFICAFFDGVTLSATLVTTKVTSFRSYLGVVAHVVPEVMLVGVLARTRYDSNYKAFLFCLGASGLFALGNTLSQVAAWLGTPEGILLGLAAGMMTYIATAHLIPKFMSGRRETALAIIGFASFLITEIWHHHHA